MRKLLLAIILISFGFTACKSKKEIISEIPVSTETILIEVNTDSIVSEIIKFYVLNLDSENYVIDGHFLFSSHYLPKIYDSNKYSTLWSNRVNRVEAIDILSTSWQQGLLPKDYNSQELKKFNANFDSLSLTERAEFDILLTDGVLLYSYHLLRGKLDPKTLSPTWNFSKREFPSNIVGSVLQALNDQKVHDKLCGLEPNYEGYRRLKMELEKYSQLVVEGGWDPVSITETIRPKKYNSVLPKLRKRLMVEGFLPKIDLDTGDFYGEIDIKAVKSFQETHGLQSDGVIGSATVRMLNTSAEDKLKMIITNLERVKWMTYTKEKPYIIVNIASFKMKYFEYDTIGFSSNVVVGKVNRKTPVFQDELTRIVLNPTWTLPYSISSTETLYKLKRDSLYLQKNNMILLDYAGEQVSDSGINWNKFDEKHFPYIVRQQPGPNNALGQVKFLFPNQYAIYLHDTPSKYLFAKEERAFSHGCIRLQNPLEFAAYLLEKQDTAWSIDSIHAIVETREVTKIRVRDKTPIYILYQTAGVNEKNEIFFYHDIYGRDEEVYRRLMNDETDLEKEKSRMK